MIGYMLLLEQDDGYLIHKCVQAREREIEEILTSGVLKGKPITPNGIKRLLKEQRNVARIDALSDRIEYGNWIEKNTLHRGE